MLSNSLSTSKVFLFVIFIALMVVYHLINTSQVQNFINNNDSLQKQHIQSQSSSNAIFNDVMPSDFKFENDDNITCEFNHDPSAPIPVILMSQGRSGSSVTWDTISSMLGSTTKAYELTGGNRTKSERFFAELKHDDWPIQKSCIIQNYNIEHYENPVISGFQWKPFFVALKHPKVKTGLKAIAANTNPPIKVILLSRNPLDRIISNLKHMGYQNTDEVPAHCAIDDQDCIERHRAHTKGTMLPTGKKLIQSIKGNFRKQEMCREMLSLYGVQYISVTYEALYNDDQDVSEWIRIFDFLGKSPKNVQNYRENLTMKDVEDAFAMAPTSSKSHKDKITNYEEVKKTLVEAGMQDLLH